MDQTLNKNRLFYGSCFALITTAFSFSIRAGILEQLGDQFKLNGEQLGFINSMWFLGFPIAMIIGGLVYHTFGPKKIMMTAFVCHALGILLTLYPQVLGGSGYPGLLFSTFLIGIGNGCTEAACNPMIADSYQGAEMSKMLNRFHMWFPGGIVIGSLISEFMTKADMGWQAQIWFIIIPTLIYAYLFWGQEFPKSQNTTDGVEINKSLKKSMPFFIATAVLTLIPYLSNLMGVQNFLTQNAQIFYTIGLLSCLVGVYLSFGGLYLFMFACMALTAISEFGPQQWTGLIMKASGASPMIILALVTGLMAVARYFGGEIVHRFDQTGVLLGSAILATIGIYLFSTSTGGMTYVAAIFFALGIAYFWPNMVGFIAEKVPKSGALGMSIIGGVGMFSTSIFQPIIGKWIDSNVAAKTAASGLTMDDFKGLKDFSAAIAKSKLNLDKLNDLAKQGVQTVENFNVTESIAKLTKYNDIVLNSGQATLTTMVLFPLILIFAFTALYFWQKNAKAA
jgi:MFS transporter, putative metabolite:H+ symporter